MCLLAVLGIALASYLAVANNSMKLANRAYASSLSRQLAEMGLVEGMRAFNNGSYTTWTANGTTATWSDNGSTGKKCTITFPSTKFGTSGITGSVKIRVDNSNANQLNATWSSSTTYRIGDLIGSNGIWYRSLRNNNLNQTPSSTNLTWWAPNPMPWTWSSDRSYAQYEMVNYKGIWYRCITAPPVSAGTTTYAPAVPLPATTYWTPIPSMRAWASGTDYSVYDVVAYTDANGDVGLYRCTTAHTSSASFSTDSANWSSNVQTVALAWSSGTVYTRGAIVYNIGGGAYTYRWYYCINSGTSSTAPYLDTAMWAPIWPDTSFPSAPIVGSYYSVGSYISYQDNCYRCTTAHTYVSWASSSSNWANIATDSLTPDTQYVAGDYAVNSGAWYRCTKLHKFESWGTDSVNWTATNATPLLQLCYRVSGSTTSNNIFFFAGSTWYRYMGGYTVALTGGMHTWSSGIKYNLGDAAYYAALGQWYRCILSHTSSGTITPSNTSYWATAPRYSNAWDSGRQYGQNDTVRYNGVWYLSLRNSNYGQNPKTVTSYWIGADTSNASYLWNASTAYSAGDYRCYGGVWYKCTSGNTGQTPNNSSYWTASWPNSWGITTGTAVIYAQSTITLPDGTSSISTELRAPLAPAPLFPNAAAATSSISANSGGTIDSYDSTIGTVAAQGGGTSVNNVTSPPNNGTYASQRDSSTNYSAVLAAGYAGGTAITLSSTDVRGYLAVPANRSTPYGPLYSSGGTVKGFTSPASPNIDVSRISRSPFIPQFDTVPGGAGGLATNWTVIQKGTALSLSSTTNLGAAGDTVPSRYYYNGNLTIGTASLNVLRINGPVILYVNGDLFITNSGTYGRIEISSAGSAEIHIAGRFMADAGGEGILNYTSDPRSLIIICDTTSTSTHFYSEGVNDLYGVIYVPYSTSTTGYYNNNNNTEIFGAVSANNITYSGANMNIHYDTSLRYTTFGGVDQPYAITQWRELTDPSEQVTLP